MNWFELYPSKHAFLVRRFSSIFRWLDRSIATAMTGKFLYANFNTQWFCFEDCFTHAFTCDLNRSRSFINSKSAFTLLLPDTLLVAAAVVSRSRKEMTYFTHNESLSNFEGRTVSSSVSVIWWTQYFSALLSYGCLFDRSKGSTAKCFQLRIC